MSLNGLDNVNVKEAHDAAIAEPGGWFLLKYTSRDEVDLLGKGNGGIVEIRNAIAQSEMESPLFGFLRYRRRNVLIKYVPEGCSRLVQARATVHFNAITERFSPYDAVFPIASSKELKDSALSAACSLHTASGSTSSSTSSLRRRRLMEIAEDENEDKRQSIVVEERPASVKTPSMVSPQTLNSSEDSTLQLSQLEPSTSFRSMASDDSSQNPPTAAETQPRSLAKSLDARRVSSQSHGPGTYGYGSLGSNGRPKVKLWARPSLDISGQPQTSQSFVSYRPVSTLPPGLKLVSKQNKNSKEAAQLQASNPPSTMLSPPTLTGSDSSTIQTTILVRPHTSGGRPTTSSGTSIKPLVSPASTAPKSPTMTPEKIRLMKAMQLRKKQLASLSQAEPKSSPQVDEIEIPSIPEIRLSQGPPGELEDKLASLDDMARADSAIAIEAPSMDKAATSEVARTISTPDSLTEPSEEAGSTQASSVSESTDETVHVAHSQDMRHLGDIVPVDKPTFHEIQEIGTEASVVHSSVPVGFREPNSDLNTRMKGGHEKEGATTSERDKSEVHKPLQDLGAGSEHLRRKKDISNLSTTNATAPGAETGYQVLFVEEKDSGLRSASHDRGGDLRASSTILDVLALPESSSRGPQHSSNVKQLIEATEIESPPRQVKIPRSKFSAQPIDSSQALNDAENVDVARQSILLDLPNSPVGSTFSNDTKRSLTEDEYDDVAARQARKKRRGLIEPIRTDISADQSGPDSETDLLSDDDLMDELQSAMVQEAKPISVSKSPNSPIISREGLRSLSEGNRFSHSFSNPLRKDMSKVKMLSPQNEGAESSRSVSASAAFLNRGNQQTTLPVVKKVNLGSSISQRIKALEKLSNHASPPGTTGPTQGTSPVFFSVGSSRSRTGSKSPSIAERSESLTRNNLTPPISRESSPETLKLRDRSGSIQSRREAFNSPLKAPLVRSRPESISVTARIIRDPSQPFPLKPEAGKDPLDFTPLDLQQSPLVIDHQKAIVAPSRKEVTQERRLSNPPKEVKNEQRSSITIVKDLINDRRSSFAERRKSISTDPQAPSSARSSRPPSSPNATRPRSVSSRRSSTSRDLPTSLSSPGFLQGSVSPTALDDTSDKKSGRASRMLRLISGPFSGSRKSLAHGISPTVREESEPPNASSQSPQFQPVEIGDVNVQFPDNLLWKRRWMSINSQGLLVLSQAQSNKGTEKSMAIKRYRFCEFRTPFVPEMEVQELPNSVVLDFIDGGGLQVAVEDRAGQMRLLEVLLEAHRSYGAYGQ